MPNTTNHYCWVKVVVPPAAKVTAAAPGPADAALDGAAVTPVVKELFHRAMTLNLNAETTGITLQVAGRPVPMPPVGPRTGVKHSRSHKRMASQAPGPEVSMSIQFHAAGRPVPPDSTGTAKASGASQWHLESGSPIEDAPETELHPIVGTRNDASMWLAGDEGRAWAKDALALKLICFSEKHLA